MTNSTFNVHATAAEWEEHNPIIANSTIAYNQTTFTYCVGDGSTRYSDLEKTTLVGQTIQDII
jgi:hypothetical protein